MNITIKWQKARISEWFDVDLWTCDPKINRNHLLIGRNPCTKFGIDQVKGSKDIEQTTPWLGLQTDRPTYPLTNSCRGIKINYLYLTPPPNLQDQTSTSFNYFKILKHCKLNDNNQTSAKKFQVHIFRWWVISVQFFRKIHAPIS